jgi:hypothetical protein
MNAGSLGGACRLTLLHDAFTLRCKLLDPIAEHLCPYLCSRKEGGEELPYRGFSEDQSDTDQDPGPCCERSNAGEQAGSAATSNAPDAAAVGREDDLNERKQTDKCKQ